LLVFLYIPKNFSDKVIPGRVMSFACLTLLMPFTGGKEFAISPRVLKETLIFPYVEGLFFCLHLRTENDPWKEINDAFSKRLPTSTEHILHPDKYLANEPVLDCKLPDFSQDMGKGWKELANNVCGELLCTILFKEYKIEDAEDLAAGWGGDRYSVLEHTSGQLGLIWLSSWDTRNDAREFFWGYKKLLAAKFSNLQWQSTERAFTAHRGDVAIRAIWEREKVLVLEGIPSSALEALYPKLAKIRFAEAK
jgi:hypothetical protein